MENIKLDADVEVALAEACPDMGRSEAVNYLLRDHLIGMGILPFVEFDE